MHLIQTAKLLKEISALYCGHLWKYSRGAALKIMCYIIINQSIFLSLSLVLVMKLFVLVGFLPTSVHTKVDYTLTD